MFHGSMVALVTPMHSDGSIDFERLAKLVEWHIANGTRAIVAVGTTGESATLTDAEQLQVIKHVIKIAAGRIPVIAGSGANATAKTITLTEQAMHAGVDACLIVTPYYNKPTQEGLYQHYKLVAEKVAVPIILYNVPARTSCDLLPETVIRLSEIPNIIGIKEASGKIERVHEIFGACHDKLDIYSGDDKTALDLMFAGGKGVISVTANVAPKLMSEMCAKALNHEQENALAVNEKLMPLHKSLGIETNPIPCKWALKKMDLILEGIRLPLTPLSEQHHQTVIDAMQVAGIQ